MSETSNAEIARRLDLLEQLLRDLPDRLDAAYLRRETYEADQRADGTQIRGLEAEIRALRGEISGLDGDLKAEREARERALKEEAKARKDEKDRRDAEAATMRRLVWTSLAAPVLVAIITAILLGTVLQ